MDLVAADSVTGKFNLVDSALFDGDSKGFALGYEADRVLLKVIAMILGDVNADGAVDALDIAPFNQAITNPNMLKVNNGFSRAVFLGLADINNDGSVDGLDISPFLGLIFGGDVAAVPEPASLGVLTIGLVLIRHRRARAG